MYVKYVEATAVAIFYVYSYHGHSVPAPILCGKITDSEGITACV